LIQVRKKNNLKGANIALFICNEHDIRIAMLTESRLSCGSGTICDGRFLGKNIEGVGGNDGIASTE